jgi:hypothetical protein
VGLLRIEHSFIYILHLVPNYKLFDFFDNTSNQLVFFKRKYTKNSKKSNSYLKYMLNEIIEKVINNFNFFK